MTDSAKPTLLVVDGHSLAYRAFFALPVENFSTAEGQHTNAVYGFTSMLINLLRDEEPTHIAAAFDVSRKTFRSEMYPEYKAQRSKSPDEFNGQVDLTKEVLDALGVSVLAIEPMLTLGTTDTTVLDDDWTVVTDDGSRAADELGFDLGRRPGGAMASTVDEI